MSNNDKYPLLTQEDFYPPQDNRVLHSMIRDVNCKDEYQQYIKEYNRLCDEEEIYDEKISSINIYDAVNKLIYNY